MTKDTKLPSHSEVNPDDFFICDAALLPLVDEAENGCLTAQQTLFESFADGTKAKVNLTFAHYYLDLASTTIDGLEELQDEPYNIIKDDILWNKLQVSAMQGNMEEVQHAFYELIEFMQANIPLENWDFSRFQFVESLIERDE